MFEAGLRLGDTLTNDELRTLFKCGNMGGMRRSRQKGTLVIISDDTKSLYKDEWKNGILHYTGMGKLGDQSLEGNQNGTFYYSDSNGIEVHLFEVMERAVYTYRGIVQLADEPYQSLQADEEGQLRRVWIFPLKPVRELDEPEDRALSQLSSRELERRSKISRRERRPKTVETTVYYRDPYLKELIKRIAEGKCQFCGADAPFLDRNHEPYLEEHHIKRLADGGTDTIDNIVAICPNCHRRMHVLNREEDILKLRFIAEKNEEKLNRLLSL